MERQQFRDAMARLGSAVTIVTSDGEAGIAGTTVSAVCSVTDQPPTLLVCLNRSSRNNMAFRRNGRLCINILSAAQEELARTFSNGSLSAEERFAQGRWRAGENGSPLLTGAAASLECDIADISEVGTHSVFFCRVTAASAGEAEEGLIYFDRAFHRVGQPASVAAL
ncbi:MAG TPA: flavin reductase [Pseudorhizobium sp.]|jgi:flavin reductase|nr:flavin reductase [Pseudorhizobium sp.]